MALKQTDLIVIGAGAVLALGALGLLAWKRGGGAKGIAAQAVGSVIDAGDGAVSGAVGAVSQAVGLPTPDDTSTDAAVARWLIDNVGQLEASRWTSAGAYIRAQLMDAGSGRPPAKGSPAYEAHRAQVERRPVPSPAMAWTPYGLGGINSTAADSLFGGGASFASLAGIDGIGN